MFLLCLLCARKWFFRGSNDFCICSAGTLMYAPTHASSGSHQQTAPSNPSYLIHTSYLIHSIDKMLSGASSAGEYQQCRELMSQPCHG
mmetsp:Transcript_17071/g.29344  ORF Transcript_17071/g.29344 Transcript_17071/m.29344 type:complete len:88 (-) Transcript_17071:188-451(-)